VANAIYTKAKQGLWSGDFNVPSNTMKVTLIDAGNYTVAISTDRYMNTNTVPSAARVGSHQTLGSKTVTDGVFDAADVTFTAVSGASVEAIIIWKDGGDGGSTASGTNDLLLIYIDTGTNLPVTPNGGDIAVAWNASGIAAL
jgi:hypothetical protein